MRAEQNPGCQSQTPPPLRVHVDTTQGLEREVSQQKEPFSYKIKLPKASLCGLLAVQMVLEVKWHVVC